MLVVAVEEAAHISQWHKDRQEVNFIYIALFKTVLSKSFTGGSTEEEKCKLLQTKASARRM